MKLYRLNDNRQKGFTLIEMLVAVAITGLIAVALFTIVYQMFTIPIQSRTHMLAVKQVENAIHWLSRDVQQAQAIELSDWPGFPINLTWVEWDNTVNQVTYTLENGELERAYSINEGEPVLNVVARYIGMDPSDTNCRFNEGMLSFRITAALTGFRPASETREGELLLRAAQ